MCETSEATVSHREGAGPLASSSVSSEARPPAGDLQTENKLLSKVTKGDLESESSEDGVILLAQSDSDASALNREVPNLSNREKTGTSKEDCEKANRLSPVPESNTKVCPLASQRERQKTKANRKLSLWNAVSAVMESDSDESENLNAVDDFSNVSGGELSSPLAQPSELSQSSEFSQRSELPQPSELPEPFGLSQCSELSQSCGLSQSLGRCSGPKDADIYTRLKMRFGLQEEAVDPEKLSASNKLGTGSQWCEDLDMESNDSLNTPLVIDESPEGSEAEEEFLSPLTQPTEVSLQSSRTFRGSKDTNNFTQPKNRCCIEEKLLDPCEDSASDRCLSDACHHAVGQQNEAVSSARRWTASKDIQHMGFSTNNFFRKKTAQVTPKQEAVQNNEKPLPVTGSNLNISGESVPGLMLKAHSNNSESSDVLFETQAKPLAERETKEKHRDLKKRQCSESAPDPYDKIKHERQAKVLRSVLPKEVSYCEDQGQASLKLRKKKLKEKKQEQTAQGKNTTEQIMPAGDTSDSDDMPLNHLRWLSREDKNSQTRRKYSAESDVVVVSGLHGKVQHKSDHQWLKKQQKKETSGPPPKNANNLKGQVSPSPFSPPVSPVVKIGTRQNQMLVGKKRMVPKGNTAWSVTTADIPHKKSVYSLSESTEDEAFMNQSLKAFLEKQNRLKSKGTFGVFTASIVPSDRSARSSSESNSGDQAYSIVRNFTVAKKNCSQGQLGSDEPWNAIHCNGETLGIDEPWNAIHYNGETLKFPVIKLEDVLCTESHPTAVCGKAITSNCKRERNLFDCFKPGTHGRQSNISGDTGKSDCFDTPSKVSNSSAHVSKLTKAQMQSVSMSAECNQIFRMVQPANLDESRLVLKKQRTVKKIAPKLCTTLRLRKQASQSKMNSASEVEEWTVVIQDKCGVTVDDQPCGASWEREFTEQREFGRKVC